MQCRCLVLVLVALVGCREPAAVPARAKPQGAVEEPPVALVPSGSTGPAHTDAPELSVVVDDGAEAAALREALSAVRGQTPAALRMAEALDAFYEQRKYRAVLVRQGRIDAEASEILDAVRGLTSHGITIADYDVDGLSTALADEDANPFVLELRVLDLWLSAASRLLAGSVDPTTVHADWSHPPRQADLVAVLTRAVDTDAFGKTLEAQAPAQPEYASLRTALQRYRERGDAAWPKLALGDPLNEGATGARVVALRERLRATGDLEAEADGAFDTDAVAALRAFQARHGLGQTGALDRDTVRALNETPAARVDQIVANLERWRWMPEDLGDTHVRVNIAAFTVEAWRAGTRELVMNAVVGKPYRSTPVFSDEITHVVLNPRWSVPIKLAIKDVLPKIKKDPQYLNENGFRVFRADTGAEVDASEVPWDQLSSRRFGYILRQEPGADNALGRLKIMFPNDHDVYLHDTPKRHLFKEAKRAFSSGCVRLEDPRGLAAFLLDDERWTEKRIDKAIATGREQTVWLAQPVPIHLQYWTAWVDDAGTVHFREDLYGRDARLLAALAETPAP